jgi:hypothetical protein
MTATPRLALTLMDTSQGSKEVTYNAQLYVEEMIVQSVITDKDSSAPPGSPVDGSVYIVAATGSGAWTGKTTYLAQWIDDVGAWAFYTPFEGLLVYVADEDKRYSFNGTTWEAALGRLLTGTAAAINPASIAAGGSASVTTVTVTGAAVGDTVEHVSHADTSTSNWEKVMWLGQVSATDTVSVSALNTHSGAVDLASATVTVRVRRA